MLSKKDKEWIVNENASVISTILDEVNKMFQNYLVRNVTLEKAARQNGEPEKTIKNEEMNILDFIAKYIPLVEGGFRGCQSDINKLTNRTIDVNEKIQIIAQMMVDSKQPVLEITEK